MAEKVRALSVQIDAFGKSEMELIKSGFFTACTWSCVCVAFTDVGVLCTREPGVWLVTDPATVVIGVVTTCVAEEDTFAVATGATFATEATCAITLDATLALVTDFCVTVLLALDACDISLVAGTTTGSAEATGVKFVIETPE